MGRARRRDDRPAPRCTGRFYGKGRRGVRPRRAAGVRDQAGEAPPPDERARPMASAARRRCGRCRSRPDAEMRLGSARLGSARLGSARLGSMPAATVTSCAPNHRPVSTFSIAVSMTRAGCSRSRVESSSSASPARICNHPGQCCGIIRYFVLNVRVEIRLFHVVFIKFRRFGPAGEAMRGEPGREEPR